ncbi:TadE/TadG family type IV pilus assembly protein [Microbacterium sp. NPDC087665]|uniref:TadE/TadG family type IV pilus assembly protein n=1 Tax=Microbacterium sp. NPDC087665 TaxID=3364194 RepID=UPI0038305375
MLRWRAWARDETGSAALEFVTVGVILLVPLVYLVIVLGSIQEQSLGAEAAARHMARAIALAPDAETAEMRSEEVLRGVVEEYGIESDSVEVSLTCVPASAECPAAGATIVVTVEVTVQLPFVPSVLGIDRALAIPLEASATQKISRQWGSE